jgi:hypothetical protein
MAPFQLIDGRWFLLGSLNIAQADARVDQKRFSQETEP